MFITAATENLEMSMHGSCFPFCPFLPSLSWMAKERESTVTCQTEVPALSPVLCKLGAELSWQWIQQEQRSVLRLFSVRAAHSAAIVGSG